MRLKLMTVVGCWVSAASIGMSADAVSQLKSVSAFSEIDLKKLADGDILTQRGGLTKFRRCIAGESCYLVMKKPEAVAKFIRTPDPSKTPDGAVFFHCDYMPPLRDEHLAKWNLGADKFAVRRFVTRTLAITPDKADFAISKQEAQAMAQCLKDSPYRDKQPAETARRCWALTLKNRDKQFGESGLGKIAPYEMDASPISPTGEMKSLLEEHPNVVKEFEPLLNETGLNSSRPGRMAIAPQHYVEMINWDVQATVDLGVVLTKALDDGRYQILDVQYFSSGMYYVSLCLQELWPVTVDGKDATLVWRVDLLSAPTLEVTRGIERMAYAKIMMIEIKKSIQGFKKDIIKTL
ncbi:MAG: hypothetical protein N2689_14695 [Verrucomicrobiae bacterium]|nr:hypothetical protein [Verrucomicrobiae bacterium]